MIYLFVLFRILEHSYALARGFEERGKRPNYRPVLEHDGLFWHRAQNQVNYALTFILHMDMFCHAMCNMILMNFSM